MAAMYMAYFFAYLIVSVGELIAWILFKMGKPGFVLLWVPLIGLWGSIILYAAPPVFALLHIILKTTGGGLDGNTSAAYYTNDLILGLVLGGILWIVHSLLHILYTKRFVAHAATFMEEYGVGCVCDDVEIPDDATEEEIAEAQLAAQQAC